MKEKVKICRNCEYSKPTKRNSKVIYYCNKHYSRRTHNGKLKIKAGHEFMECKAFYRIPKDKTAAGKEYLTLQHIPKTKDR